MLSLKQQMVRYLPTYLAEQMAGLHVIASNLQLDKTNNQRAREIVHNVFPAGLGWARLMGE